MLVAIVLVLFVGRSVLFIVVMFCCLFLFVLLVDNTFNVWQVSHPVGVDVSPFYASLVWHAHGFLLNYPHHRLHEEVTIVP